ncbi:hypothetical protein CIG75_19255 [Tumebacillus algifaecis]|uniref:HTH cro/C1-type domain-containing protein n=1 Tax=Tumebacillus algifaecis TaxID=1214604 RepID=A0A223D5K2_9BACL|nr:helix-turn-helix transcriptional regulator [Tumebacillus algifaecis]ASS76872.1 hypothetical protein CIG75_19255 [Tumebacillus algifaecis]
MKPEILEEYRLKKGLSITEVASQMGKTPGWYSRIKDGKQGLHPKYVAQLASVLGVKPEKLSREYFFGNELEQSASCANKTVSA